MEITEGMKTTIEICEDCQLPEQSFAKGDLVLEEGKKSNRLYVLKSGKVEVVKQTVELTRIFIPGSIFGEVSVLLDQTHTANVQAVTESTFYVVDDAKTFLRSNLDFNYHVSTLLARRLESLSTYLVDVKKQYSTYDDHFGMVDEVLEGLLHNQPRGV